MARGVGAEESSDAQQGAWRTLSARSQSVLVRRRDGVGEMARKRHQAANLVGQTDPLGESDGANKTTEGAGGFGGRSEPDLP